MNLPPEAVEAFYDEDAVRLVVTPPRTLPPADIPVWLRVSLPDFPVAEVKKLDRHRWVVTLAEPDADLSRAVRTFVVAVPPCRDDTAMPRVSLTMNGKPYRPPATETTIKNGLCSRPVRVRADTHALVRQLSAKLGEGVADTIDRAARLLAEQVSI